MGVKNLTPKMADRLSRPGKRKTTQIQVILLWITIEWFIDGEFSPSQQTLKLESTF